MGCGQTSVRTHVDLQGAGLLLGDGAGRCRAIVRGAASNVRPSPFFVAVSRVAMPGPWARGRIGRIRAGLPAEHTSATAVPAGMMEYGVSCHGKRLVLCSKRQTHRDRGAHQVCSRRLVAIDGSGQTERHPRRTRFRHTGTRGDHRKTGRPTEEPVGVTRATLPIRACADPGLCDGGTQRFLHALEQVIEPEGFL
jgi:hypothetical protein